jgi:uncharacterized membrane protein
MSQTFSMLFSLENLTYTFRCLHFFFGVIWIGHLYYFNFTQGPFMAEAEAPVKSGVTRLLLPRALWWFRFGAMYTFLTGLAMWSIYFHQNGMGFVYSKLGSLLLIGSALGVVMFLNVWLVIWPNQQVVMRSANAVAQGGAALPEAAGCAAKALLASRHNTLFSIPMLFFMGAGRHLMLPISETSNIGILWLAFFLMLAGLEYNALKGTLSVITTVKGVITYGFALTGVLLLLVLATV